MKCCLASLTCKQILPINLAGELFLFCFLGGGRGVILLCLQTDAFREAAELLPFLPVKGLPWCLAHCAVKCMWGWGQRLQL